MSSSDTPHSSSTLLGSPKCSGKVHFDNACVLIPDPIIQSRMPRLVKKSYSLPLWRKRSNSSPGTNDQVEAAASFSPSEDKGVVFTVSVPSFVKPRSPSRDRIREQDQPLVPCIVDSSKPRPTRRTSLPLSPRSDAVTIPLRPCCHECYPITEESFKEGIEWEEKFSRAARRRRNSSADALAHTRSHGRRRVCDNVPGFDAIVSVDEVDKRHKHTRSVSPSIPDALPQEEGLLPSFSRKAEVPESLGISSLTIEEKEEDATPPERKELPESESLFVSSPLLTEDELHLSTSPDSSPSLPHLVPSSVTNSPEQSHMSVWPRTPPLRDTSPNASSPISFARINPTSKRTRNRSSSNADVSLEDPAESPSKRTNMHFPTSESFMKFGAQVLRGVGAMGGSPALSV